MAFSSVTARGSAVVYVALPTGQNYVSVSPSANLTVGKLIVATVTTSNIDTSGGATSNHDSVADNTTTPNTWTKVAEYTNTAGVAADGITVSVWYTVVTTQIGTGNTVTATLDAVTEDLNINLTEATIGATSIVTYATPATAASLTANVTGLTSREYFLVHHSGAESADQTKAAASNYTEIQDFRSRNNASAASGYVQYRIATLTSDSGDKTPANWTTPNDPVCILVPFYETAAPLTRSDVQDTTVVTEAVTRTLDPLYPSITPDTTNVTEALTYGTDYQTSNTINVTDIATPALLQTQEIARVDDPLEVIKAPQGTPSNLTDNVGAASLTVPDDATFLVLGISGYQATTNYFTSGTATLHDGGTKNTYETEFPTQENPISEDEVWINGDEVGLDWTNVRTSADGLAYGTQTGSDGYDDSLAILTGTWGNNQYAKAIVHLGTRQGSPEEVELLLRFSISANDAHGYEFLFPVYNSGSVEIVRWNGDLGDWDSLGGNAVTINNGDVIEATATGDRLCAYVNGVIVAEVHDSTWSSGSIGVGFFSQNHAASSNFGLHSFECYSSTDTTALSVGYAADSNTLAFMAPLFYAALDTPHNPHPTFSWDWAGTSGQIYGVKYVQTYYKGVDLDDPIRDSGGTQQADSNDYSTGELTALDGDYAVAWCAQYAGGATTFSWTNATEIQAFGTPTVNAVGSLAEAELTGNVTITCNGTGDDGGIAALILKPGLGGVGDLEVSNADTSITYVTDSTPVRDLRDHVLERSDVQDTSIVRDSEGFKTLLDPIIKSIPEQETFVTEDVTKDLPLTKSLDDTTYVTDYQSFAIDKFVYDSVILVDLGNTELAWPIKVSDSVTDIDLVTDIPDELTRSIEEAYTYVTDNVEKYFLIEKNFEDTIEISEDVVKYLPIEKSLDDSTIVSEDVARHTITDKSLEDTSIITEDVQRNLATSKQVEDTLIVSEEVTRYLPIEKLVYDDVTVEDIKFILIDLYKEETTYVSESIDRNLPIEKSLSDSIVLVDLGNTELSWPILVSDVVTDTDLVTEVPGELTQNKEDTTYVTENVDRYLPLTQSKEDTTYITEEVTRDLPITKSLSDSVVTSDSTPVLEFLTENLTLNYQEQFTYVTESLSKEMNLSREIADSVVVSHPAPNVSFGQGLLERSVDDSVGISEVGDIHLNRPIYVTDFVRAVILPSDNIYIQEIVYSDLRTYKLVYDDLVVTDEPAIDSDLVKLVEEDISTSDALITEYGIKFYEDVLVRQYYVPQHSDDIYETNKESLLSVISISLRVDIKYQRDSGTFIQTANETWVPFNKYFRDIQSITLTVQYSNYSRVVFYDFEDTPNPQGFYSYVYDLAGSPVTGDTVSWMAEGVGGRTTALVRTVNDTISSSDVKV